MSILQYLELGEEALPAVEAVISEVKDIYEQDVKPELEAAANAGKALIKGAEDLFETVKTEGIAGTDVGQAASNFAGDATTLWLNMVQDVEQDATKVAQLTASAVAQLQLLGAKFAAGQSVEQDA